MLYAGKNVFFGLYDLRNSTTDVYLQLGLCTLREFLGFMSKVNVNFLIR